MDTDRCKYLAEDFLWEFDWDNQLLSDGTPYTFSVRPTHHGRLFAFATYGSYPNDIGAINWCRPIGEIKDFNL